MRRVVLVTKAITIYNFVKWDPKHCLNIYFMSLDVQNKDSAENGPCGAKEMALANLQGHVGLHGQIIFSFFWKKNQRINQNFNSSMWNKGGQFSTTGKIGPLFVSCGPNSSQISQFIANKLFILRVGC